MRVVVRQIKVNRFGQPIVEICTAIEDAVVATEFVTERIGGRHRRLEVDAELVGSSRASAIDRRPGKHLRARCDGEPVAFIGEDAGGVSRLVVGVYQRRVDRADAVDPIVERQSARAERRVTARS